MCSLEKLFVEEWPLTTHTLSSISLTESQSNVNTVKLYCNCCLTSVSIQSEQQAVELYVIYEKIVWMRWAVSSILPVTSQCWRETVNCHRGAHIDSMPGYTGVHSIHRTTLLLCSNFQSTQSRFKYSTVT